MRKIFQSLPISFSPYRSSIFIVIFCHLLAAIFTVVSVPMIIPFFHILFQNGKGTTSSQDVSGLEMHLRQLVEQTVQMSGEAYAVLWICGIFILLFFFKNIFRYLAMYFMTPVRNAVVRDLRQQVFDQFQKLPVRFLKENPKGNLISIMMSDVQEVEWMFRHSLETIIKSPLIIIGCIGFMLYLDPRLTLFVFVLLLFTVLVIGGVSRALKQESKLAQSVIGELSTIGDESLTAYPVVRSFSAEAQVSEKFLKANNQYKNLYDKVLRRKDLASPLSEFLGVSIVAVLLWYGSGKVFSNSLSPEAFFAFLFAFFQIIEPAKSFASSFFTIRKGMGSLERLQDVLQVQEANRFSGSQSISGFNDSLEFQNVSFSYEDNVAVLTDNTLKIAKGEIIHIKGKSGVGKSTILQLLLRFYDPVSGDILIDGNEIKQIKISEYRQLFAYVDQRLNLFHDTIASNISFGSKTQDMSRIREAARLAYADDFIDTLPENYDTVIGERGTKLSGGQGQRIALARAFYHNAPILLLDEATSSIDEYSEGLIKKALSDKNQEDGTTIIMISHQDSMFELAHRSFVFSEGKLVETGTKY